MSGQAGEWKLKGMIPQESGHSTMSGHSGNGNQWIGNSREWELRCEWTLRGVGILGNGHSEEGAYWGVSTQELVDTLELAISGAGP